jgi:hypothetical protein
MPNERVYTATGFSRELPNSTLNLTWSSLALGTMSG